MQSRPPSRPELHALIERLVLAAGRLAEDHAGRLAEPLPADTAAVVLELEALRDLADQIGTLAHAALHLAGMLDRPPSLPGDIDGGPQGTGDT